MEAKCSYAGTSSSRERSAERTRGRRTGTRRPPRLTEPSSWPWRTAVRAGSWRPLGPHSTVTLSSKIASITCSPVPTARASRPSRSSSARFVIAIDTASGTAIAAGVLVVW